MAVNFHQPSVHALWDVMPLPMLTFSIKGELTFANQAAKKHAGRPSDAMDRNPVIKSLAGDVTLGRVKLPYTTSIQLAGGITVKGQFMAGPSGLDMAVVLLEEVTAVAGPQRMALADIIALLRDEVGPPMQKLVTALGHLPKSSDGDRITDAADQLRERLRRLGDLVAVFGDEVMRNDDRVEIAALLKSVCTELAPKALARRVRFNIEESDQTLPPLYGNMAMIRRAFYECIDNALSNSRREVSSPQVLEVKLSCRLTGEHVLISVRNQGALPSDFKGVETRDLFKSQSKDAITTGGSRLGLPLVHRIVGLHGGNMRISEVGDDEVRVLMEFPTGAPLRAQSQLDIAQIQRYATDLAQLMSRRKKESV